MLTRRRHASIVGRLRADGAVRVSELVPELRVSGMAVRRDIDALEAQRHLVKAPGGATLLRDSAVHEPGFDTKRRLEHGAKATIARLPRTDTVITDSGLGCAARAVLADGVADAMFADVVPIRAESTRPTRSSAAVVG